MKLRDYGEIFSRDWIQQLLQWSRNKVSVVDNLDCVEVVAYINTTETVIGHSLGRVPRGTIPIMKYPFGTVASLSFTREPTIDKIYLTRSTAGYQGLLIY